MKDPEFERLYESSFERVYRAAYLLCRDRQAAEDAAQEAFTRALERWGRLAGQEWVVGWLVTTAINHARRRPRSVPFWPRPQAPEPEAPDASLDLWAAVRKLSHRQQEAVVLHYVADLPIKEVATVMGCDGGTVKTHLARARETLGRAKEVDHGG